MPSKINVSYNLILSYSFASPYLLRARYWLACVDFPQVRTTLTWHITAPADLTSLANGSFEGEEITEGLKTTHWKLDYRW